MKLDDQSLAGDPVMLQDEDVVARIRDIANGTFVPSNALANFQAKSNKVDSKSRGIERSARSDLAIVNNIKIATPCKMDWDKMTGDERKRYCQECKLHVYNVSELSPRETVDLLQNANGGRVCLQLYRRKDGTVMTRDCPVALWKLKKAYRRAAAAAAGLAAWLGIASPSFAQGGISVTPEAPGQMLSQPDDYIMGGAPAGPLVERGEAPVIEGGKPVSMAVGKVSSVRVNNLENIEKKAPNWILLGVSLLVILTTLKLLLKKKSSMWIIGATMVAMFAALGYAMVALAV